MKKILAGILVVVMAAPLTAQDPAETVKRKIDSMKVTVDFKKASLEDVVDFLRDYANLNMVIDPSVREECSEEDLEISIRLKDIHLKSLLKFIVEPRGLAVVLSDGVLQILPRSKLQKRTSTKIYDIRDLLFVIRDFAGPVVELKSSQSGPALVGADFTVEEEPQTPFTEDFVVDLVRDMTGGGSWDENPNAGISFANGLLVVTQTARVHKQVAELLQKLRQFK